MVDSQAPVKKARAAAGNRAARVPAAAGEESSRLTREHWIQAAHEAAVEGGFSNIKVLAIADTMGVTRGSFYWHFKSHADLVDALVERWRLAEVARIDLVTSAFTGDPVGDLLSILDDAMAWIGEDMKTLRFELALRAQGRQDSNLAARMAEIDQSRIRMAMGPYSQLVGDGQRAWQLSVTFYLAISGASQSLGTPGISPELASFLRNAIAEQLVLCHAAKGPDITAAQV